jgi:hypothetical protein
MEGERTVEESWSCGCVCNWGGDLAQLGWEEDAEDADTRITYRVPWALETRVASFPLSLSKSTKLLTLLLSTKKG